MTPYIEMYCIASRYKWTMSGCKESDAYACIVFSDCCNSPINLNTFPQNYIEQSLANLYLIHKSHLNPLRSINWLNNDT